MATTVVPGTAGKSIPIAGERSLLLSADSADLVLAVERGLFALECRLAHARRRVLDFLLPGDMLASRMLRGIGEIRLRAVEAGSLHRLTRSGWLEASPADAAAQAIERAGRRAHLANLIIGVAQVDARVATFLLALAARWPARPTDGSPIEVPIARDDVADHILVNPDTLSRSYSRLREQGAIARSQRNRLVIRDLQTLRSLSPLAGIVETALA